MQQIVQVQSMVSLRAVRPQGGPMQGLWTAIHLGTPMEKPPLQGNATLRQPRVVATPMMAHHGTDPRMLWRRESQPRGALGTSTPLTLKRT